MPKMYARTQRLGSQPKGGAVISGVVGANRGEARLVDDSPTSENHREMGAQVVAGVVVGGGGALRACLC